MRAGDGRRILLISSNSSGRGGGERYLVFLARGLRQLGCSVDVLLSDLPYMDGWARDIEQEGAHVHRKPLVALAQRPLRFVQALCDRSQIAAIADFCRHISPDAIVVNQQYDEDGLDYVLGAVKSAMAPVCGVMHMPMTHGKNDRKLGRWRGRLLGAWYKRVPYHLVFVSTGSQREFESYYRPHLPTSVVNNGIPWERHETAVPMRAFPDDGVPVVGFVGQFVPQKNLDAIIGAWLDLRQAGRKSRLLLVGDGPERERVANALGRAASAEDWHITGWTENPEAWFEQMDVFVLASKFEGLPLSLVEAAARGLPAVVTPFNGASDVARRAAWVKVATDNSPRAVAQLLAAILSDRGRQAPPSPRALEEFRQFFSVKRMAADLLNVVGLRPRTCT